MSTIDNNKNYTIFSWGRQSGKTPMVVESASGSYFFNDKGQKFLDFSSQFVNVNLGHGNKNVKEAILAQMDKVSYMSPGIATEVRGLLGKKIASLLPGKLNKTFFTLGGADAVENAIKIARAYTGKSKIIAQYRSYHGGTYAAMSVSGDPRRKSLGNDIMPNVIHVENPYVYRCPWGSNSAKECMEHSIRNLEQTIQYEDPSTIAAIILEGESGTSGCIKYPSGFWQKVKDLCTRYDILLIDDEVMSGFGRTGAMFAFEHYGVIPDLICMAKGLTSGYLPMGGVVMHDRISNWFNDRDFPGGLTYSAHPVCCAAALATLEEYERLSLIKNAEEMGRYLKRSCNGLFAKHPSIGDIRITGLLGCLELVKNRTTKEPLVPWNCDPSQMDIMNKIQSSLLEQGVFCLIRWNMIIMAPPLIITKEDIDFAINALDKALAIADTHCACCTTIA